MSAQADPNHVSPWTLERPRLSYSVLRVIDLAADTDTFKRLAPASDWSDLLLDGCTAIRGQGRELTEAERIAVIAEYDARWRARQATLPRS